MTPEEFIGGLRERGYRPTRTIEPAIVLLARIDGDDKLFGWLQDVMGVKMIPYVLSAEVPKTYEAQLHHALVTVPPIDGEGVNEHVKRRERAIWDAAAV